MNNTEHLIYDLLTEGEWACVGEKTRTKNAIKALLPKTSLMFRIREFPRMELLYIRVRHTQEVLETGYYASKTEVLAWCNS
jgi:hypothetical protein